MTHPIVGIRGVQSLNAGVDAPEAQRSVAQVQLAEPVDHRLVDHLALEAGLFGAAATHLHHGSHLGRQRTTAVQTAIGMIHVGLLGLELWMRRHNPPCRSSPDSAPTPTRHHG